MGSKMLFMALFRKRFLTPFLAAGPLPPTTRAAALMAIVGIALVGLLLVAIILLGGNWVRRQGRHRRGSAVPPDRAPLAHPPREKTPGRGPNVDETIADDPGLRDTQV